MPYLSESGHLRAFGFIIKEKSTKKNALSLQYQTPTYM